MASNQQRNIFREETDDTNDADARNFKWTKECRVA